ncbi:MAG: PQQ-dependent sugar dehydrogenase, partial [Candidatus Dormibacteraceae bacterium]
MPGLRIAALASALLLVAGCGPARPSAQRSPTPLPSISPSSSPSPSPSPTPLLLPNAPNIHVPAGFRAQIYASDLAQPTAIAVGPDGRLYVAEQSGNVVAVTLGGAGQVVARGLRIPLGLAFDGSVLLIAVRGGLESLQGGTLHPLVSGLPAGVHQQDGLAVAADGSIFLGSGSTCDVCQEPDPRSAAILHLNADGSGLQVYASGTRNPYGLAIMPSTNSLYSTVNGQDNLGAGEPADALIKVTAGAFYGWPRCWPNLRARALSGICQGVTAPVAYLAAHTSADGFAIYSGASFPAAYQDHAFVAEWGANSGGSTGR